LTPIVGDSAVDGFIGFIDQGCLDKVEELASKLPTEGILAKVYAVRYSSTCGSALFFEAQCELKQFYGRFLGFGWNMTDDYILAGFPTGFQTRYEVIPLLQIIE
jgi:hypothetical protein